jgi:chemotaxis protein MotB
VADKKGASIVIKKKKGGHGGAHGGAWKVAFADFMTALMCFFLVMWLMGADEPSESTVTHYFNTPNSPYKAGKDPKSDAIRPMGERNGPGDSVLSGLNGQMPDDPTMTPVKPPSTATSGSSRQLHEELAEIARDELEGQAFAFDVSMEYLKFSLPEDVLFPGGRTELGESARKILTRVGQIVKGHGGYLRVYGHSEKDPRTGGRFPAAYEASLARAVSVMNYLVEKNYVGEEFASARGVSSVQVDTRVRSPAERAKNRRIEFVLSLDALGRD